MKSKVLLPVLGLAVIGAVLFYNQELFSKVKATKMTASLLDDNPNASNKKIINPFPKKITINQENIFNDEKKSNYTIGELLKKNELDKLFSDKTFPKDFNYKELAYEVDIHKQNANAPRYDIKYKKEVKVEDLAGTLGMYDNPFVFTQLYHRANLTLSAPNGKYLYDEHFPEDKSEEQAYLVRKVSHLLPLYNEDNEIKYLHFSVYIRHVERGVYETYKNYVVKYNDNGTINHITIFSKNELNNIKLNYDEADKLTNIDNITFYQYSSSKEKNSINCYYNKIQVQEKS